MNLENILLKYQKLEAKLKYEKAQEILSLINDEELCELFTKYPTVFQKLSGMPLEDAYKNLDDIEQATEIFINQIKSRGLTRDEYNIMTKDDIIEYFGELFKKNNFDIFDIIKVLENHLNKTVNDSRDKESQNVLNTTRK